jgi:putative acetyltransferase
MKTAVIRAIKVLDNPVVETIIKKVMTEYDCVGEGYSINDPEVSDMFGTYNNPGSAFFVVEYDGKVIGCAGIAPLSSGDSDTCELRKMYFLSDARGLGLGQKMLDTCLSEAKKLKYKKCYLETVDRMNRAKKLYLKNGFKPLTSNMGQTGHSSCDSFYCKVL